MAIHKHRPLERWIFDKFCISSPDKKYCLWVANGFTYFEDHFRTYEENDLLSLLTLWQRYKFWRMYKREKRLRSKILFNRYAS